MNLQAVFRDFNPGKFIVWLCLAIFSSILSLRLDGVIDWSYWVVFSPLWVWKGLVIIGAFTGNIIWWRNPHYRLDTQAYVQYRALLISLGLHIFLLMFEVLVANNLESHYHPWTLVFAPLVGISTFSIGACVWAVKHDRSFELELFCSVNLLQFIFIPLRLDNYMLWQWEIVFIPAWILLCVSMLAVLYSIIFTGLLLRLPYVNPDRRRTYMNSAIGYTCLVAPFLIFLITLSVKLNGNTNATYNSIMAPLYISYSALIVMSFNTKRANQWWFGLRKDGCQFILSMCPLLQEYANISYSFPQPVQPNGTNPTETGHSADQNDIEANKKKDIITSPWRSDQRVVVPALSLETPD